MPTAWAAVRLAYLVTVYEEYVQHEKRSFSRRASMTLNVFTIFVSSRLRFCIRAAVQCLARAEHVHGLTFQIDMHSLAELR